MTQMKPQLRDRLTGILSLHGWCSRNKAIHMAQLILDNKPEVLVEVGVFGGRGCLAMAMACQHSYHGHVHAIDPWTKEAALEEGVNEEHDKWWATVNLDQIYATFVSNMHQMGLQDWVTIHRQHDTEAVNHFADGSVQFLHLDGNHAEGIALRSSKMWAPKLAPGAVLVFDDVLWPSNKVALDWLRAHPQFTDLGEFDMMDEKGEVAGRYAVFQRTL